MNRITYIFLSAYLCLTLSFAPSYGEEILVDKAVAIANDDVILQSELDGAIKHYLDSLEAKGIAAPAYDVLRKNILDQLITQSLILQLAKKIALK